jgi:hypothetical protein
MTQQKASEDALASLHGALANELAYRIKNGEKKIELVDCDGIAVEHETKLPVGANVLSVARQFLKDNHIEAGIENKELADLVDTLPFDEEQEQVSNGKVN